MIDLTSDKIRTDVIRSNFFNEDKLFFGKLNITRKSYTSPLGLHIYLRELSDGYYYAKKWDRSGKNMEEVVIDGKLHLTPVIDFENSFLYNKYFIYDNPYVRIPKDVENIDMFLNDFPEAYKYFLEIFDIEVEELTECIESNYPIKVDNEVKEEYNRTISKNQKILKAIR